MRCRSDSRHFPLQVSIRDISESVAIFAVMGPKSGDLCRDVIGDAELAAAGRVSKFGLGGSEVCLCSPRTRCVLSYFSRSHHILNSAGGPEVHFSNIFEQCT